MPFILGAIIAYLLNPLVLQVQQHNRVKRKASILLILGSFLIFLSVVLAILLPLLIEELLQFIDALPGIIETIRDMALPWVDYIQKRLGLGGEQEIKEAIGDNVKEAVKVSGPVAMAIAGIGQSLISVITIPLFTIIIAYFMMNEWPRLSKWTENMIPRPYQDTVKSLAAEMNTKISGFIRGQFSVALILGVSYAVALSVAGLNYGVLIGFVSGVLCIIPMVGSTVGLLVSIGVAFSQEGTLSYTAIIASIFLVGQLIEGNVLTPKIVGDSVGLHPLWVFFALLAGASLMGITGMLIAVPVAAVASVILGFAIEQYKKSAYYQGDGTEE